MCALPAWLTSHFPTNPAAVTSPGSPPGEPTPPTPVKNAHEDRFHVLGRLVLLSVFLEADLVSHWPQRRVGRCPWPTTGTQPGQPPEEERLHNSCVFPTLNRVSPQPWALSQREVGSQGGVLQDPHPLPLPGFPVCLHA